jgi:excinuclease UvrABC nuclease subunit
MIFIYGLYINENNEIRYVGKTNNLMKRLKEHINQAK